MTEGWPKEVLFRSLRITGLLSLAEHLRRGVSILAYHGVTAGPQNAVSNRRRLHVPAPLFEEHLRLLRRAWNPVGLGDFLTSLADRRALPPRSVVLTFDDGYRNVLTAALPLLARYEVPATLLVVTDSVGSRLTVDAIEVAVEATSVREVEWQGARYALSTPAERAAAVRFLSLEIEASPEPERRLRTLVESLGNPIAQPDDDHDLLTWDELRALRDAGVSIGSHAQRHVPLTDKPFATLCEELRSSHRVLRERLGDDAFPLAYPLGAWSEAVALAAREAGFTCGLTTDPGLNRPDADVFGLRRMLIGADDDPVRLRASLCDLRGMRRPRRGRTAA